MAAPGAVLGLMLSVILWADGSAGEADRPYRAPAAQPVPAPKSRILFGAPLASPFKVGEGLSLTRPGARASAGPQPAPQLSPPAPTLDTPPKG